MIKDAELIPTQDIAPLIYLLRDQRVILDSDLARIYLPTLSFVSMAKRASLYGTTSWSITICGITT